MKHTQTDVDLYIENTATFARPILKKVRAEFHTACPEIQESIKWGCPFFEYHGIVGGMSATKKHVSMVLWKGIHMDDPNQIFSTRCNNSQSVLTLRSMNDFPQSHYLTNFIKAVISDNQAKETVPKTPQKRKPATVRPVPVELQNELKTNKKAREMFERFSPSHKNEYSEWIAEAKKENTKLKRVKQALEWIAEGKPRNWKYMKK